MLIRASPFPPWVYANSLFAVCSSTLCGPPGTLTLLQSIEAVALWQFVIATFVVFPKVALHVFIGSRLAALSDGETRRQMDTRRFCPVWDQYSLLMASLLETKILNGVLVGTGLLIAFLTSWYVLSLRSIRAMTTGHPLGSSTVRCKRI